VRVIRPPIAMPTIAPVGRVLLYECVIAAVVADGEVKVDGRVHADEVIDSDVIITIIEVSVDVLTAFEDTMAVPVGMPSARLNVQCCPV
jgi:hypothetical protein